MPDNAHITALGTACHEGTVTCARVLLEARAHVDGWWEDRVVYTPLMLACDGGHVACVELLLRHHASTKHQLSMGDVDKGEPRTAMEFAEDGAASDDERRGKTCARLLRAHESRLEMEQQWAERCAASNSAPSSCLSVSGAA
jgi:ankyrin repeat protein